MIKARDVAVAIGRSEILRGIDLDVPKGSLVAVVGANGAGKTTLLRALSRLLPLARGSIQFDGAPLDGTEPHVVARAGLAHVPQGRQIVPQLSVEDNLLLGTHHVPGLSRDDVASLLHREFERFPVLRERRHLPGGALSGGEQQMLAISRGLMMRPKLLMLDEPSLGLAPQVVDTILAALKSLTREGLTVLLVEQAALLALRVADAGYVLEQGRVAMSGPSSTLLCDPTLVERYLG